MRGIARPGTTTSSDRMRERPTGSVAISGCRAPLADPPPGVPKRRACSRPPSGTSGTRCAARRTQCRVAWLAPRPTPPPGKSPARSTSRWHYHRRTTIRCDGHSPSRAAQDRGYPTRTPGRPASTSRRPLQSSRPPRKREDCICAKTTVNIIVCNTCTVYCAEYAHLCRFRRVGYAVPHGTDGTVPYTRHNESRALGKKRDLR